MIEATPAGSLRTWPRTRASVFLTEPVVIVAAIKVIRQSLILRSIPVNHRVEQVHRNYIAPDSFDRIAPRSDLDVSIFNG